jgi:hypothetical protein
MREIKPTEVATVSGGQVAEQKLCTYAGQTYSEGAVVSMPGGNKTCRSDGSWGL